MQPTLVGVAAQLPSIKDAVRGQAIAFWFGLIFLSL
jgi:hypothetical protein